MRATVETHGKSSGELPEIEVLVAKGFGTRDNNTSSLPIDEHTIFRLGSVSKGFASVLTGMMVDQGLLSFETGQSVVLESLNSWKLMCQAFLLFDQSPLP